MPTQQALSFLVETEMTQQWFEKTALFPPKYACEFKQGVDQ